MGDVRLISKDRLGDAVILMVAILLLGVSALSSAMVFQAIKGRDLAAAVPPQVDRSLVDLDIPRAAMFAEARGPIVDMTQRAPFIRTD